MDRAEISPISDAQAVERTLAGERDAYRVLVERHSRNVYQLAYRMMGNPHDAEEVVQEAFLRGYQKLSRYTRIPQRIAPWSPSWHLPNPFPFAAKPRSG